MLLPTTEKATQSEGNPIKCIHKIMSQLSDKTIERTKGGNGKGFFVKIPLDQVFLDATSNEKLLAYTNLPEHIVNYNFLLSQKKFMQIIQNGGMVKLHSYEWINKSSGRGDTELIVDDGTNVEKYSYPYWFPFTPYTEVFPRLFPWADFSANEDFYQEEDESLWRDLNCYYDKEDDEWLVVEDTFEEFRKKLNPMRSINHSGEVNEFKANARFSVRQIETRNKFYRTIGSHNIGYLFGQYQPYMWWVLLATAGVWSIVMGVFFAIAQKNEDKEKARKMIKNYVIGLVVIFVILVACPYLVKGIAALIAG